MPRIVPVGERGSRDWKGTLNLFSDGLQDIWVMSERIQVFIFVFIVYLFYTPKMIFLLRIIFISIICFILNAALSAHREDWDLPPKFRVFLCKMTLWINKKLMKVCCFMRSWSSQIMCIRSLHLVSSLLTSLLKKTLWVSGSTLSCKSALSNFWDTSFSHPLLTLKYYTIFPIYLENNYYQFLKST